MIHAIVYWAAIIIGAGYIIYKIIDFWKEDE